MWTADSGQSEAVLIDPAAHGGHREEDLAMLHLFGMSYLSEITEGYQSVHPLKPDGRSASRSGSSTPSPATASSSAAATSTNTAPCAAPC